MIRTFGLLARNGARGHRHRHSSPGTRCPMPLAPYPNCTVAKQNGDCDIPSSSDKYQSKLDRDSDGLGCEC